VEGRFFHGFARSGGSGRRRREALAGVAIDRERDSGLHAIAAVHGAARYVLNPQVNPSGSLAQYARAP